MAKPKILVLCTGNSCRSQMAEGFLRKYHGDHFDIFSAGLNPSTLHPLTVKVMEEAGIDMSGHYAKSSRDFLGRENFRYLITVCDRAEKNCPTTFLGVNQRLFWPFEDPASFEGPEEQKLVKFREIRDQIETHVRDWNPAQPAQSR